MIKLRHYQAGVTPAVTKYLRENKGKHPLVALPTGSGKTYCIADLIKLYVSKWDIQVLVVSHVKEILSQNYDSLKKYLPEDIDLGVNSSMLGRRECKQVTVAGIQSIFRSPERFQNHKLIIVDEAHLISTKEGTMYQRLFAGLPNATVIGFTATPFRLGDGYIYGEDKLFDDLVYDWTSSTKYTQLISEGFMSPLTTKRTKLEMDISGIKLIGGDFNEKQLSDKFDREIVTNEAIKEIMAAGVNRKKWLIFAIDINHAEHIAEVLIRNGIRCAPVHSRMSESGFDRNKTIQRLKDGEYRAVVNVNILTTGFDDPGIDLIAMLRPTHSPVLHVQTLGRGSRIQDGKIDCLVLDFAGNTERLGPINDVLVKIKGKGKGGGEPLTKTCPECESILPPAVKICPDCGHKFVFQHGLSPTAARNDIIENGKARWLPVTDVKYYLNKNPGSPTSVKVDYECGGMKVSEWICIEHRGFAKHKADHWVKYRGGERCNTADDLLRQAQILRKPVEVYVSKKGKYFVINDAKFRQYNEKL